MTTPYIKCDEKFAFMQYGFLWWVIDKEKNIYSAIGDSGNVIYVNAYKNIVISVADISVELEIFDEKRVTKFWEDDIEALKAKIDELLADENMGETEKAKLNENKAQCDKLIENINTPVEYFSLRFFYIIWDCLTWKWDGLNRMFEVLFGFKAAA